MAGAAHSYDNSLGYAKSKGYSQTEFDDWYAKNQGAVSKNEGSGGDFSRVEAAFGAGKTPAVPAAAPVPAGGGGGVPGAGGGSAMPPSVQSLAGGAPAADAGDTVSMPGVGAVRGLLGRRTPPRDSMVLAGIGKVY